LRSSLTNLSSTTVRGWTKSNAQYSIVNSKTRNGTFGLKCWVSSHSFRNFFNWLHICSFIVFLCIIYITLLL
jgi:hypothetical protein